MKRLLVLCGLLALLAVPAASAGSTGPTLSADCSVCAAGSTIALTGAGYDPSKTYAVFAYQANGSNFGTGISPNSVAPDGTLARTLVASAPFFPASGAYTVVIDLERGHKLIQVSSVQLTIP